MRNGYDLISFKDARIEALQKELARKDNLANKLQTFIFELLDKDCPEDYKRIVKAEVFADVAD